MVEECYWLCIYHQTFPKPNLVFLLLMHTNFHRTPGSTRKTIIVLRVSHCGWLCTYSDSPDRSGILCEDLKLLDANSCLTLQSASRTHNSFFVALSYETGIKQGTRFEVNNQSFDPGMLKPFQGIDQTTSR